MRYSVVMIVPAEARAAGDNLGAALGWGDENFTVPLGDKDMASHYGLRAAAGPDLVALLSDAGQGRFPDLPDLSQDDLAGVLSVLITDTRPDSARDGHFEAVIASRGLLRIDVGPVPDPA
jgi:hypothetical protein